MLCATVTSTDSFREAIYCISSNNCDLALQLLTDMISQYRHDTHSETELGRWIALALHRLGRLEEAYRLLRELESNLITFRYDLSAHYYSVVTILRDRGTLDELRNYCKFISPFLRPCAALSHLDWIAEATKLVGAFDPCDPIATLVVVAATQLGLDIASLPIHATEIPVIVKRCIEIRDDANQRYEAFWSEWNKMQADDRATDGNNLLFQYLHSEPCPIFRELAYQAFMLSKPMLPDNETSVDE